MMRKIQNQFFYGRLRLFVWAVSAAAIFTGWRLFFTDLSLQEISVWVGFLLLAGGVLLPVVRKYRKQILFGLDVGWLYLVMVSVMEFGVVGAAVYGVYVLVTTWMFWRSL